MRGLRAGLPIRLVAALHDTSVAMIERHYSRWITEPGDVFDRKTCLEQGTVGGFARMGFSKKTSCCSVHIGIDAVPDRRVDDIDASQVAIDRACHIERCLEARLPA